MLLLITPQGSTRVNGWASDRYSIANYVLLLFTRYVVDKMGTWYQVSTINMWRIEGRSVDESDDCVVVHTQAAPWMGIHYVVYMPSI